MLFQDAKFDIGQVIKYFSLKSDGDLAIYYEMEEEELRAKRWNVSNFFYEISRFHMTNR